ncbi:MAG: hypothetical protein MUC50_20940 [Myxococcota bacterium]|nr:hypothetical protein [Myxococcota bacterium]
MIESGKRTLNVEVPCKPLESVSVVSVDSDVVSVRAATALPPGTRVRFVVERSSGDDLEVRGKIVTVARESRGDALLRIKLTEVSKSLVEALRLASGAPRTEKTQS